MDLNDAAIEAALESFSDGWRHELFRSYDELTADDFRVPWSDSPPDITIVDGVERRVFQIPYPIYSDGVRALMASLSELVMTYPFAWMDWDGPKRHPRGKGLGDAPVADAARMATSLIRGERFCDGRIARALEDGTFAAVMERLRTWHDLRQAEPRGR